MLAYTEPLGRVLRAPLRWIPPNTVVRVLSGPNRGLKWRKGASHNGFWLGTYEREFAEQFAAEIRLGAVVYDIGANVGYYTLMAARRVGPTGRVYAFDPIARNLEHVNDHAQLNGLADRVRVFRYALGATDADAVTLTSSGSDAEWRVGGESGRHETAPMATLDHLIASGAIQPPNVIKLDIEGFEAEAITGASDTLERYRPVLCMGDGVTPRSRALLRSLGYRQFTDVGRDLFVHY